MNRSAASWAVLPLCLALAGPAPERPGWLRNGVTAHRGNSGEYPENTLPAFESALALGADWIELDVYLTRDRQLAVTHDKDTGRVGGRALAIGASTFAELQAVDVATRFRALKARAPAECPPARIPLLADVLRLVMRQARTRVSLQPKDECVQEAFRVIRELGAEPWVGFNAGSLNKLRQVKTQSKAVPVFWDLAADADLAKSIRTAKEEGFESLVLHKEGLTREKIDAIHLAGLEAGAWTINAEADLKRALALGADRIYTDYPARLLRLRQAP